MKAALAGGDLEGGLQYLLERSRERYRSSRLISPSSA